MKNSKGDREPPLETWTASADSLDRAIEEILGHKNPGAYSIFTAIERFIRQFKLSPDVEAHGLLSEAYLCGKKAIAAGQPIHNPHAWLKGTAYNLAREKARKQRPYAIAPEIVAAIEPDRGVSPEVQAMLNEQMDALYHALRTLWKEDREVVELLYQRCVEGKSWREISSSYAQPAIAAKVSEVTLRQRLSRGRKRLRSIFHRVTTSC